MFNIVVCDDNESFLKMISIMINGFIKEYDADVYYFDEAESAFEYITNNTIPTIFLLDIELEKRRQGSSGNLSSARNGIDLGTVIRKQDFFSSIVYITNYSQYAFQSLRNNIEPQDFIKKTEHNLSELIKKNINIFFDKLERNEDSKDFYITINERKIFQKKINFITTNLEMKHKIDINCDNGLFTMRASIKDIFDQLKDNFVLCHRSSIVNLNKIISIDFKKKTIYFNNGFCYCNKEFISQYKRGDLKI